MAKKIKIPPVPSNDDQEAVAEYMRCIIAGAATSGDASTWQRKMNNMTKLVNKVNHIEDEIATLRNKATPLYDQMAVLRNDMVSECVHPYDMLVHNHEDGTMTCKFCDHVFAVVPTNS